jgi:hypothetical protein
MTLERVFDAIDPKAFENCFWRWALKISSESQGFEGALQSYATAERSSGFRPGARNRHRLSCVGCGDVAVTGTGKTT